MEETKRESTDKYLCKSCGGNMAYDPKGQSLLCPYCGNTEKIEVNIGDILEYDLSSAKDMASLDWGGVKKTIHCDSCGADTIIDENTKASFCPFCGSSHVLKNDNKSIAPESLIPFKITLETARGMFKEWILKRHFAPSNLKKTYRDQKLSGVYIPYWTYDSDTYSTYIGEAGEHYYVPETHTVTDSNGKRRQETRMVQKTRWYPVSGDYSEFFNDILVNASKNLDKNLISSLEPFKLEELVHYDSRFLSGYLAEKYSIDVDEGFDKAKAMAKGNIYNGIVRQINADEVRNLSINTTFNNVKFKHMLLPVWMSSYTYKEKIYRFYINGQTGEVQGESPISPLKVFLLIISIAAFVLILYFLFRNR